MQLKEYLSIWKSAFLAGLFAFALGYFLITNEMLYPEKNKIKYIFLVGLSSPAIIYMCKLIITRFGEAHGVLFPDYLRLHYVSYIYYVSKSTYMCFCPPALYAAIIALNFKNKNILYNIFITLLILINLAVFYFEDIKNGFLYSFIGITLISLTLFIKNIKFNKVSTITYLLFLITIFTSISYKHLERNHTWSSLFVDAKVAIDINKTSEWKFNGKNGFPLNENGSQVAVTTYERISWARSGIILASQNLLGYGLVERSFGVLAKIKWPESTLSQTHSGWIDLTLGIGIPGILLIFSIILFQLIRLAPAALGINAKSTFTAYSYRSISWWILLSQILVWCTSELSQKVYFENLIFWVCFSIGVSTNQVSTKSHKAI